MNLGISESRVIKQALFFYDGILNKDAISHIIRDVYRIESHKPCDYEMTLGYIQNLLNKGAIVATTDYFMVTDEAKEAIDNAR